MPQANSPTSPVTIRTDNDTVAKVDAMAGVMERSRNYVVNQAIEEYLAAHAWQIERIQAGLEDARTGRVVPAEDVFAELGAKYGWDL